MELQSNPNLPAGTFATLTYDDEHLWSPMGRPSVHPRHVQLFKKSLAKKYGPFRSYIAAEYGDRTERPHYHALLFHRLWTSEELQRIWKKGHVHVDSLNAATIMYTAQYVTKKLYGALAAEHYSDRFPPFALQSQSLGKDYLKTYLDDIASSGKVYIPDDNGGGHLAPLPRNMLEKLKLTHPDLYEKLKQQRIFAALNSESPDYQIQNQREKSAELIAEALASQTRRDPYK